MSIIVYGKKGGFLKPLKRVEKISKEEFKKNIKYVHSLPKPNVRRLIRQSLNEFSKSEALDPSVDNPQYNKKTSDDSTELDEKVAE